MPAGLGSTLLLLPVSAQHCCFVGSVGWTAAVLARFRLMMASMTSFPAKRCECCSIDDAVASLVPVRMKGKNRVALFYGFSADPAAAHSLVSAPIRTW